MPADQIQIRWNSWSGSNYDDSMAALKEYDPIPSVKAACNIKGTMPKEAIDRIMDIVNEFDAEAGIIMTATWGNNAVPNQLRLFAPNSSGNGRRRGRQRNQPTNEGSGGTSEQQPDEEWEYPHADGVRAEGLSVEDDSEPSPEEVADTNIAEVIH